MHIRQFFFRFRLTAGLRAFCMYTQSDQLENNTRKLFYFFSSVTFKFFVFFANFLALASIWMENSIYRIFHTTRIINSMNGRTVALLTTRDKFMEMTKSFRRQPDISRNSDGNCDKTRWLLKLKESGSRLEVKHSRKVNLSAIYFTCHFNARSSMPQLHKLGLMRGKKMPQKLKVISGMKTFQHWPSDDYFGLGMTINALRSFTRSQLSSLELRKHVGGRENPIWQFHMSA